MSVFTIIQRLSSRQELQQALVLFGKEREIHRNQIQVTTLTNPCRKIDKSKHLKGRLGPRVSDAFLIMDGGRLGPSVSDAFLIIEVG